jgi:ProP effector
MHTRSRYYLSQIAKASTRFDLDANAEEQLMESHRTYASTILKERVRKDEERRLMQYELEQQRQREAAEAARKRAEKIGQLAEKFSRPK